MSKYFPFYKEMEEREQLDNIRKKKLQLIKNNSQCFNDRILKYIKYGFNEINKKIPNWILEIYKNLRVDDFFENKNPKVIAAGFVYFICIKTGVDVTQRQIAEIYFINEGSIRSTYSKLKNAKAIQEINFSIY